MSDAFRDAELLATAIDEGLSGRRGLEEALADYQRRRDERALPEYERNCRGALLEGWDSLEMLRLRAALRGNEEETGRYLGVGAKAVSFEEFYAPENVQRIVRAA